MGQTSRAFVVLNDSSYRDLPIKKPKLAGIGGVELQLAYNSLLKLKKSFMYDETEEESEVDPNELAPESFEQHVDKMLSLLGFHQLTPCSLLTFFSMMAETLTELKITFTGFITLKPNSEKRIAATASLGKNELWSSVNLSRQLLVLETLISRTVQ